MRSILITGGKGFIGRRLVRKLPHALVWDIDGKPSFDKLEGIIHLAGVSRVKDGEENPTRCVQANVGFTAEILHLAHLYQAWVVMLGTQETGDNFYGMSKRFSEDFAKKYAKHTNLRLFILRPGVVWGPGDKKDKIFPRIVSGEDLTLDPGFRNMVHVDEVVETILESCGKSGEKDMEGDLIRLESLKKLVEYVANPDS